ncbi:MAG TPA: hypothetical protein VMH82_11085 [Myxococcota bacterium]|nr:hypothetical protein [Myxococcota bacterium]
MQRDPIERLNLALSAGAVAASFAVASPAFATSLALGAAIESVNFRVLRSASRRALSGELAPGGAWVAGFSLRFVLLAVAISFALRAGAQPVALVIGLSMIVPAAIAGAWVQRPPVGEPEPGPPTDDESWDRWNPWLAREREPEEPQ